MKCYGEGQKCPGCGSGWNEGWPCGCVEFTCGGKQTCDDYHHGEGALLDCPKDGNHD